LANLRSNVIGIVFALGLLGISGAETASAQNKGDGYVQVIQSAVVEFDAGNWAEARVLFEQAHTLRPSARTLRGMGMTSFEMKEYVRAEKELNASLVDLRSPLAEAQRHEVLALLLRLERYVGKLVVHTRPPNANPTITLDGSRVEGEMKVDLGRHELSVQAPGYRPINRVVSIEGGKTQQLELTLTPLDLDARSAQPVAAAGPGQEASGGATDVAPGDVPIAPMAMPDEDPVRRGSVFKKWWFWTIVGAVAAGGAAAAIVVTSKSGTEPPLRGNTGVAVGVLSWSR
jgi:hypothetical protein